MVSRHTQPTIGHNNVGIGSRSFGESFGVSCSADRNTLDSIFVVRDDMQIGIENDSKQSVTADNKRKQLGIFRPAAFNDFSVGGNQTKRFDRRTDWPAIKLPAVAVDAEGAAD